MTESPKSLAERMCVLADTLDDRDAARLLYEAAWRFQTAVYQPLATFDMKSLLGVWARARRLYSQALGEPLV